MPEAIRQAYDKTVTDLDKMKASFKEMYNQDIMDAPQIIEIEYDESVCAMPDVDDAFGEESMSRVDIKLMDDKLIRRIEAHLAGVPRVSDQFREDPT